MCQHAPASRLAKLQREADVLRLIVVCEDAGKMMPRLRAPVERQHTDSKPNLKGNLQIGEIDVDKLWRDVVCDSILHVERVHRWAIRVAHIAGRVSQFTPRHLV